MPADAPRYPASDACLLLPFTVYLKWLPYLTSRKRQKPQRPFNHQILHYHLPVRDRKWPPWGLPLLSQVLSSKAFSQTLPSKNKPLESSPHLFNKLLRNQCLTPQKEQVTSLPADKLWHKDAALLLAPDSHGSSWPKLHFHLTASNYPFHTEELILSHSFKMAIHTYTIHQR